ncbi:MAG: BrnT family toxin [Thermomicrobiales bacterium]
MRFEWDEEKRLINLEKHQIDFVDAQDLFDGREVVEIDSAYEFETRKQRTGFIEERMVTAVWTPREDAIRIISVRSARDAEKRKYRELYG